jgi:hypothetical protein
MPNEEIATDRPGSETEPGPPTRRRGPQLEAALLEAAWDS